MEDSSFNRFENMVLNGAKRQRDEKLAAVDGKKTEIINKQREAIKADYEKRVYNGKEAIKRQYNRQYCDRQVQYKREYLDKRNELTQKVFRGALKDIEEYKKTPKYSDAFRERIKGVIKDGGEYTAVIDKNDTVMEALLVEFNIPSSYSDTELLGGLKLIPKDKNICYDLTFAARYDDVYRLFCGGKYGVKSVIV